MNTPLRSKYLPKTAQIVVAFAQNDLDGRELYDYLNYYRLLRRQTWKEFTMEAYATLIGLENEEIANAIIKYMQDMPRGVGRPRQDILSDNAMRVRRFREKQKEEIRRANKDQAI